MRCMTPMTFLRDERGGCGGGVRTHRGLRRGLSLTHTHTHMAAVKDDNGLMGLTTQLGLHHSRGLSGRTLRESTIKCEGQRSKDLNSNIKNILCRAACLFDLISWLIFIMRRFFINITPFIKETPKLPPYFTKATQTYDISCVYCYNFVG